MAGGTPSTKSFQEDTNSGLTPRTSQPARREHVGEEPWKLTTLPSQQGVSKGKPKEFKGGRELCRPAHER